MDESQTLDFLLICLVCKATIGTVSSVPDSTEKTFTNFYEITNWKGETSNCARYFGFILLPNCTLQIWFSSKTSAVSKLKKRL